MGRIETILSAERLEALMEESGERDVWLFKHSLVCGVSDHALGEFRRFAEDAPDGAAFALVEIQRRRELSHAVARSTGVSHESPQALLLRGGRAVWHGSHWSITLEVLRDASRAMEPHGRAAP